MTPRNAGLWLAAAVLTSGAGTAVAQNADYTVPGISAWTTAKTYGFEFAPEARSGESVSRPRDGMNTRLTRTATVLFKQTTLTVAQVVGGQPSVNQGERVTTFRMFSGRTLQPGWTVKRVDVGGNFTYVQQSRLGTTDLSFRVSLAPGGTATLKSIVLTGPAGADWKDAFSAPVRKDYVINGVVAWNAAKKYGFQFYPTDSEGSTKKVTLPYDGVFTVLWIHKSDLSLFAPCVPRPDTSDICILAQIAGGNLSVPIHKYRYTARFVMFAGKKLAPGWVVKAVSISNGTYIRQAVTGSDDLSFVLQLTSSSTSAATAIIPSITLEGPSNAASFEDAFKNAP